MATGATGSTTVTVAVQVWLLPWLSVAVSVTRLVPMLGQSKLVLFGLGVAMAGAAVMELCRLQLAIAQTPLLPLSICAGVMVAWPVASSWTVRSWQTATGATGSITVTVAVQVWVFPWLSVAVSVTIFAPTLLQSKLVLS